MKKIITGLLCGAVLFVGLSANVSAAEYSATQIEKDITTIDLLIEKLELLAELKAKLLKAIKDLPNQDNTQAGAVAFDKFVDQYGEIYTCGDGHDHYNGTGDGDTLKFGADLSDFKVSYQDGYFVLADSDYKTNKCSFGYNIVTNYEHFYFSGDEYTRAELLEKIQHQ